MLVTEHGIYISKCIPFFIFVFFLHFFQFTSCSNTYHSGGWPISWPSCFPNIMPFDVFLWGCVEDYIYRTSVDVSATRHARIMKAKKCWPIYGMNWSIHLMQWGSLGVSMLRWNKAHTCVLNEGTVCKRLHISLHFSCHMVNV